jgi:hypothetical protein
MTVDRDIVGRVGKHRRRQFRTHQRGVGRRIARIAANDPVTTQEPEVADATDVGTRHDRNRRFRGAGIAGIERLDAQINLAHVEADRLNIKVEIDARQRLELFAKQPVIPNSDFRQAIIGDHKSLTLRFREVLKTDGRNLAPTEPLAGQDAPMARDDVQIDVDQDRDIEPEGLDAFGDLADLRGAMLARVAGIGLQLLDRNVRDHERRTSG